MVKALSRSVLVLVLGLLVPRFEALAQTYTEEVLVQGGEHTLQRPTEGFEGGFSSQAIQDPSGAPWTLTVKGETGSNTNDPETTTHGCNTSGRGWHTHYQLEVGVICKQDPKKILAAAGDSANAVAQALGQDALIHADKPSGNNEPGGEKRGDYYCECQVNIDTYCASLKETVEKLAAGVLNGNSVTVNGKTISAAELYTCNSYCEMTDFKFWGGKCAAKS